MSAGPVGLKSAGSLRRRSQLAGCQTVNDQSILAAARFSGSLFGATGADVFQTQPVRSQRGRVHLNPHRGLLSAADRDQPHARQLRYLLRQRGVGEILHLRQRKRIRRHGQRQNRRVRRIHLVINRRIRQIGWQVGRAGVDGGLHLLLFHVDVLVEGKL